MDEFMTHEETAAMLRLSPGALYQMRYREQGPPAVKVGKRWLYRRSDLVAWFEAQAA